MRSKRYSVNLPAHMAECDANYLRIYKLFPWLRDADAREFSIAVGERIVLMELKVLERAPYTTLLQLTQRAPGTPDKPWLPSPQLRIRLYHDAKCAEVVEFQRARDFQAVYQYPNPGMRQPDEKAQVNRLLSELLAVCLEHGQAEVPILATDDDR
ncbi:MAG: DUF1249 domain-containing protein [Pseudomonadota bacterium]